MTQIALTNSSLASLMYSIAAFDFSFIKKISEKSFCN